MKKKKIVVIHQPDFIPYLGFFHRLCYCNVYVILDHVQLLKRGWHHRDKIKGPNGEYWLTIPINRKTNSPPINKAKIDYSQNWVDKHLQTITHFYKKAKFFETIFPEIKLIYEKNYTLLIDLNMAMLKFFWKLFSINVKTIYSSSLNINSKKSFLIFDIMKDIGGTHYLSGIGAKNYLDDSLFCTENIEVTWHNFKHPVYPQLYKDFIPYLSCLDFAMNCGNSLHSYLRV